MKNLSGLSQQQSYADGGRAQGRPTLAGMFFLLPIMTATMSARPRITSKVICDNGEALGRGSVIVKVSSNGTTADMNTGHFMPSVIQAHKKNH